MAVLPLDPGVSSSHAKSDAVDTQPEGSFLDVRERELIYSESIRI